jgi:hypothetical protein
MPDLNQHGLRYGSATRRLEAVSVETIGLSESLFYTAYRPKPRLLSSGSSIERERAADLARMVAFGLSRQKDVEARDDLSLSID